MADTHLVAEKMRLSEPTTKIGMKIDPYYQRQKYRRITVVSGGIRLCEYSQRFPGEGASNDSGVLYNGIFSVFASYFFGYFRDEASVIIIMAIRSPSSAFQ